MVCAGTYSNLPAKPETVALPMHTLSDFFQLISSLGLDAVIVAIHLRAKHRILVATCIMGLGIAATQPGQISFFASVMKQPGFENERPDFVLYFIIYAAYAAAMFVAISDGILLLSGRLTRWRGEKWVKELDYVYLALAAVGVIFAIGQLELSRDSFKLPAPYSLLMVCTALIIRAVKTRAEIGNWAKKAPVRDLLTARASDNT